MTTSFPIAASPPNNIDIHAFLQHQEDDDGDTASQRSIPLSSPHASPRNSILNPPNHLSMSAVMPDADSLSKRISRPYTLDTDLSSEVDGASLYTHETGPNETPSTSATPSVFEDPKDNLTNSLPTYPPAPLHRDSTLSLSSFASSSSRKTRPESLLVNIPDSPLVLGIALVDFNHLVGPKIEWCQGDIFENEEISKILPFLALPDGAHMSAEDYSYFHVVPSGPHPTTIFGISCNQQIAASSLLVKDPDVTRSIVQKAVVVLASQPVFGPIRFVKVICNHELRMLRPKFRDKLGVVTTALFMQKDFSDTTILGDFGSSLELSLRSQLTESGLYMGTSLRELVHNFRHKTLVLVKALMLQKRIMFHGYPVERLCTYQYSLVSLLPGLLQTLDDCGSPPLTTRAPTLSKPTSLRTSDHKSMMAYIGLPLDVFGKDAFFQPYLPLQQVDMIKETKSWLCGSTNTILFQQKEIDLLVNADNGTLEFRDPTLERSAGLTAADRKWIDEIVREVNETWDDEDPKKLPGMQFKGSDDYIRSKFEEYISAALASIKYRDFVAKGEGNGVLITGGTGLQTPWDEFNPAWIYEFKLTNAYEVWDRITDSLLFDLVEPRHPCNEKPSVVSDIGLRLQEGIQDLKLEQQLAPAREAVTRTINIGSANFFKAMEGVRERWAQRANSVSSSTDDLRTSCSSTPVEVSSADLDEPQTARPLAKELSNSQQPSPSPGSARPNIGSWSAGIGSFLSARTGRFSLAKPSVPSASAPVSPNPPPLSPNFSKPASTHSLPSPPQTARPFPSHDKSQSDSDEPSATTGMAL
ncbi:hypothetical protein AMATHDRAFT_86115 [Amanita thiersii Skay4041]|uniref:UDENN domain-containing protein n=1 Tax=Amanita thiersii Skay4041 TaxID=703135 RepID=A0A2A9NNW8_9AGAR|nr:hypothetical protein AMATHDRAFT_86115 [Amanita thiersii Skay4041]